MTSDLKQFRLGDGEQGVTSGGAKLSKERRLEGTGCDSETDWIRVVTGGSDGRIRVVTTNKSYGMGKRRRT